MNQISELSSTLLTGGNSQIEKISSAFLPSEVGRIQSDNFFVIVVNSKIIMIIIPGLILTKKNKVLNSSNNLHL